MHLVVKEHPRPTGKIIWPTLHLKSGAEPAYYKPVLFSERQTLLNHSKRLRTVSDTRMLMSFVVVSDHL